MVNFEILRRFLKSKRVLACCVPLAMCLAFITLTWLTYALTKDPKKETPEMKHHDLFVTSSYYYPQSQSLGSDAVALVISASSHLPDTHPHMQVIAWNGTHNTIANGTLETVTRHKICAWRQYLLTVNTLPNMTHLSIMQGGSYAKIPFFRPRQTRRPVVTCVAPLFAAEQWQAMLFAIHTYRRFGSHAHVYARSVVTPYFDLLKAYEKEDYLTLQPWVKLRLPSVPTAQFEPNEHVEFRNQAAAQTDCLLQYKESASFISFMDFDDVLIPRVGETYLEEYSLLFASQPHLAYLHYAKENVKVKASRDPTTFSLDRMYSSIVFDQITETGKTVANPRFVNSTWIHWPIHLNDNRTSYSVPTTTNAITHLKYVDKDNGSSSSPLKLPAYEPDSLGRDENRQLVKQKDMDAMQADFSRMWSRTDLQHLIHTLPPKPYYFNIILKCYNNKFYNPYHSGVVQKKENKCPGPEMCEMPKNPGIDCTNSVAEYHSSEKGTDFTVHYAYNRRFAVQDGCI